MNRIALQTTVLLLMVCSLPSILQAQHPLAIHGNGVLAILDVKGQVEWEMEWPGIHDIHVLENGNIMVQRGWGKVVEIDRRSKQVVWCYDSETMNGNIGKQVEVHAFQPLENGNVMIAESGPGRIIEVDRTGKLLKETKLKLNNPHPHMDTRLARKITNGNYLVCHEGDGFIREYDSDSGEVVWEFEIPMFDQDKADGHGVEAMGNKLFGAVRLSNGNTLIATGNGHSVIEVTAEHEIVWHLKQDDLPNIQLAWVTTLEVLPNGNYVIGNCHAGPNNPLLIEISPANRKVVWQLDQFEKWGNSVPNTQILGIKTNR